MFAVALLFFVAIVFATKEDLLVLTNENFYEELDKNGKMFVKFYAPWCGHCKRLAPAWEELAGTVGEIKVAEMDCTVEAHEPICSIYQVTGFPTIVLIEKNGAAMKYEESREVEDMRNWAIEMSGPASRKLEENQDIRNKDISFILTGADEEDIEKWNEEMAQFKGKYGIYHTQDKNYKGIAVNGKSIVIQKTREELKIIPYQADKIAETVRANNRLLVNELGPKNFSNFAADADHLMWITFVRNVHDEEFEAEYTKLKDASMKCGEKVNFSYINGIDFEGFTKNFGEIIEMPFSIILKPNDYLFYRLPDNADICQFVADVVDGKIEAEDVRKRSGQQSE